MMGRRKKKDSERKRSLVFEESPVENRQQPLSPVVCVDNPVTAPSVPIEADSTIAWVSPQFNGITASNGKRRQARRRHHITDNKQGEATLDKENSKVSRSSTRSRSRPGRTFPALDFVGGPSKSTPNERRQSAGRATGKQHETRHQKSVDGASRRPIDTRNTSLSDRRTSRSLVQNLLRSFMADAEVEGENFGRIETMRRRRSSFPKATNQRSRPSLACSSMFAAEDANSSSLSSADEGDPSKPSDTGSTSLNDETMFRSHKRRVGKNATQRRSSTGSLLWSQGKTKRRSERLRAKGLEALKYLQPHTPTKMHDGGFHVLVHDTPESEYGLSVKERQRLVRP